MNTVNDLSFLRSSLLLDSPLMSFADVCSWIEEARNCCCLSCRKIPFSSLSAWGFHPQTGDLVHDSGKFFRIEGLSVETNTGPVKRWQQPIMNQAEVGILGLLTKLEDGVRYFLVGAKPEPGNIAKVQIAPSVQATKSNYTQVHGGRLPPYLEFFAGEVHDQTNSKVLYRGLQSEQGGRFLRKHNLNMLVETQDDVPGHKDFRWLTLGQLKALLKQDNVVNMEARSVLACIPSAGIFPPVESSALALFDESAEASGSKSSEFGRDVFLSLVSQKGCLNSTEDLKEWVSKRQKESTLTCDYLPLKNLSEWQQSDSEIAHVSGDFFSVIAVETEIKGREVEAWTQPLVAHPHTGIVGFLVQKKQGLLHFLVQAKVEAGNRNLIELAPSVSCSSPERTPSGAAFLEYFTNAVETAICFSALLSEEGGRFFEVQNRYMVVELPENDTLALPDTYSWLTLGQLFELTAESHNVSIEARAFLACLGFR